MREAMKFNWERRSFLKWVSLLPILASGLPRFGEELQLGDEGSPNVLILVFDTLSALHIPLYGYPRNTMPNLARLAERSTVYHSHYAAGNFTTPATASLLTGTYPWTHRAFSHQATALEEYRDRNIFSDFTSRRYASVGFSHNLLVNILLYDWRERLYEFMLPNEIALADYNFSDDLFIEDYITAVRGERTYLKKPGQMSNSLFLFPIFWALKEIHERYLKKKMYRTFPLGIPGYHDMLYPLEDTIDWIMGQLQSLPRPFLAYMHMMPPHDPYYPRGEFTSLFYGGWNPDPKPAHHFSEGVTEEVLIDRRRRYDQYIAYVDAELGRLLDFMEDIGFLEDAWIVMTSDHGEMFERGIWQHTTRTLFDPVIHVPLLISRPGQKTREDVYTTTSCVDLLPTLLHVTGQDIPGWCEGVVLPPYGEQEPDRERSIYVVEAKSNPKFGPLVKATVALIKGQYKLIHYRGYEGFDGEFELYDLASDPQELNDLYPQGVPVARDLEHELLTKIEEVSQPYVR
jgi:choline-sulfatase